MAESELTINQLVVTGLDPTSIYEAATGDGESFVNTDGDVLLHVKNGDASPHTLTLVGQNTCSMGSTHDQAVAVPAGEERFIGPCDTRRFNDADGVAHGTWGDTPTSVTLAAIKM